VPGAKECTQAPQDDAGRETPERKGLRKSQVGSVSLKRFAQVQGRVAHGARWPAGVGLDGPDCCWVSERWVLGRAWLGPGIEPPSAAVRVGERCHPLVGTRHVRKPHIGVSAIWQSVKYKFIVTDNKSRMARPRIGAELRGQRAQRLASSERRCQRQGLSGGFAALPLHGSLQHDVLHKHSRGTLSTRSRPTTPTRTRAVQTMP